MGGGSPGVRAGVRSGAPDGIQVPGHVAEGWDVEHERWRGSPARGSRLGRVSLAASLAAGGASLAGAAALTGLVRAALQRHGVMDRPNERSSHTRPVPRGGGIAVVGVLLAAWLALWLWDACDDCGALFWVALAGALGLAALSWLDDLQGGLSALLRFLAQIAAVGAGIASLPGEGLVFQGAIPALADHALRLWPGSGSSTSSTSWTGSTG